MLLLLFTFISSLKRLSSKMVPKNLIQAVQV